MPSRQTSRTLPVELSFLNPIVVDDLIRCGSEMDGGYVVSSSILARADALISFGLSDNWSFEMDLARHAPDITIHAYDHSISERQFYYSFRNTAIKFVIGRCRWDDIKHDWKTFYGYRTFFRSQATHFGERVFSRIDSIMYSDVTIETVMNRVGDKGNIVLKMDIEGDEYRVIDDILRYIDRIDVMIIEWHNTDVFRDAFLRKTVEIQRCYEIIHLHGNNFGGRADDGLPEVLEITFAKRGLCAGTGRRDRLPVQGLDFPNLPGRGDYELLFAPEDAT